MGRVKSLIIKRTAKNLVKEPNKFTEKFDDNKKFLGNSMPSKRIRNMVIGYISRIKRLERVKKIEMQNYNAK